MRAVVVDAQVQVSSLGRSHAGSWQRIHDRHNAAVIGTIKNDDTESVPSMVVGSDQMSLKLTDPSVINGTGNSLDNTIVGNAASKRIAGWGGKDILTGGCVTDGDIFAFIELSDSLLLDPISGTGGYFDEITDFNKNDRIQAPPSVVAGSITTSLRTARSITPEAISELLNPSAFAAHSVVAFTVSSHAGTFIAMNDDQAGFQPESDFILWPHNYSISATCVVAII